MEGKPAAEDAHGGQCRTRWWIAVGSDRKRASSRRFIPAALGCLAEGAWTSVGPKIERSLPSLIPTGNQDEILGSASARRAQGHGRRAPRPRPRARALGEGRTARRARAGASGFGIGRRGRAKG